MDIEQLRNPVFIFILYSSAWIICMLALYNKKLAPLSSLISISTFFIISIIYIGFRPLTAGFDTPGYIHAYSMLGAIIDAPALGKSYYGSSEPLFWYYSAILKNFGLNERGYLLVTSLTSSIMLFFISKKITSTTQLSQHVVYLFISLTLSSYALVYLGNHIRASIAIPLTLTAIYYSFQNRYFLAVTLLTIAASFQISALTFAPLLVLHKIIDPLFRKSQYHSTKIVLLVIALALIPLISNFLIGIIGSKTNLMPEVLLTKYQTYTSHEFEINNIFKTVNFWILAAHIAAIIAISMTKIQAIFLYTFALGLITSSIAKVSERYLAFVMPLAPIFLLISLRHRFSEKIITATVPIFYIILCMAVMTARSTKFTLGLQ